jgi:hypothetical protein
MNSFSAGRKFFRSPCKYNGIKNAQEKLSAD